MSKTDRYIKRYGLKKERIDKVDLSKVYFQYQPSVKYSRILIDSPHVELAKLYYSKGLKWLNKNFKETKYFIFQRDVLNTTPYLPKRKMSLFDSIKKGYLAKEYKNDHIVILNTSFAFSRYNIDVSPDFTPELFMGHHRAGALLALGIKEVDVIIAVDDKPGECQCYGNLHDIYSKAHKKKGKL